MLKKISQKEFNQLYLAYRYNPAYRYDAQDAFGQYHSGFNLVKLLQEHEFSLTFCKLNLRNLDFSYSYLFGIEFIQCDLSYTIFNGVDFNDLLFVDCWVVNTFSPFSQRYSSDESNENRRSRLDSIKADFLDALA